MRCNLFVRAKNVATGEEENLNITQIARFRPSTEAGQTIVDLTTGVSLTVDISCRSMRHAIGKAQAAPEAGSETE